MTKTIEERKAHAILMQKQRRNTESGKEVLRRWASSAGAKQATTKYMQNGGKEKESERRKLGTDHFTKKSITRKVSAQKAKNAFKNWTAGQESELMHLHIAGVTAYEIAKRIGRSIISVEHKRARLKRIEPASKED